MTHNAAPYQLFDGHVGGHVHHCFPIVLLATDVIVNGSLFQIEPWQASRILGRRADNSWVLHETLQGMDMLLLSSCPICTHSGVDGHLLVSDELIPLGST